MYKTKNFLKDWYQPHQSFVVRNPLFPIETFFDWQADWNDDVNSSKEKLRESLREFYQQPIVQEALYIGSPDLYEQLLLWLEHKIVKEDKKEKLELSLVKYMIRMCTRCTPYGLFASCTAGNFSNRTGIILNDKNWLHRYGRLDMDYMCELHDHLLKQKEVVDQLVFYPNTSLYKIGDQWRYVEHRFKKETGRSYHIVEIDQSEYFEKIILAAKKGKTVAELVATFSDDKVSFDEAMEFIYELINNQVLVDELEPSVTGEEYFSIVLRKLRSFQHTEKYLKSLEKVSDEFDQIKRSNGESKNSFYQIIAKGLQSFEVPVHIKTLIQVDSYRSGTCLITKSLDDDLLKGVSLLELLTENDSTKDSFGDFKTAFINRYEGRWVSLSQVLDTESGIGYGKFATSGMEESPLIDKLPIGTGVSHGHQYSDIEPFKWQLYDEAISKNRTEVIIDDSIIEKFSNKEYSSTGLPDSFCMMAKINAASAEDIDNGKYTIVLQSPSGPSGGNLLGRFCHLHPEVEKLTRSLLKEEEAHRSDCVFAEIVHLPDSRVGNILMRPLLRKYEIPYLCGSTLDEEFQIPISDLVVGIIENKVTLRSKRLNKEVVPRLTTAHNFSMTTLPVYQFLCDLQYQNIRSIGWQWGILENRPFLPRVSHGKYILSKARWVLTNDEVKGFNQSDDKRLLQKFNELKELRNLPDYILLSQGDNELLLHLKNVFCLKLLLAEVNKSGTVILTESLDNPGTCWIRSPDGHHAGEFIFSFTKKKNELLSNSIIKSKYSEEKSIQRFFPVGSEWLYAKIYCGTKTAEKILADLIKPFTETLLSENIIDKFFFLRYHDTGNHIRIRFHNSSQKEFWKEIVHRLSELLQPYISSQLVYNLQFETYQREVERYGFDTMHLSEDIFFHQSVSVLNFISLLDGDEGEQYRWQVALKAIDLFLDSFHYTLEQKRDLIKTLNKSFADEFQIKASGHRKISERFNDNKRSVSFVMENAWKENEDLSLAIGVFKIEDKNYCACIEEILNSPSVHHDINQLNRLMAAYLHMFINRLFVSSPRKIELVIYDHLFRYYESTIAREKKINKIEKLINTPS